MDKNFKKHLNWEEKAKINPLYAIMASNEFEAENTELSSENLEIFFSKGERIWNNFFNGELTLFKEPGNTRILEFGCGMGRLIQMPARKGYRCYGVDISETQLALAKTHLNDDKIELLSLPNGVIPYDNGYFDYVFSFAVFQHINKLSDFIISLEQVCRVVKPGGILKIQLPTIEGNKYAKGRRRFLYSIPFESKALVFYWAKRLKVVPMIRIVKYDHWGGAAYYYRLNQLLKLLKCNKIEVTLISYSPSGFVLITGAKELS